VIADKKRKEIEEKRKKRKKRQTELSTDDAQTP
jgi:hypothetical protein